MYYKNYSFSRDKAAVTITPEACGVLVNGAWGGDCRKSIFLGLIMLSIITALLDSNPSISITAKSLLPQLSGGVKWLIKNSSQNPSRELIALGDNPNVTLISSADSSLYMGLNQALKQCNSKYVQVIGAGDELLPNSISETLKDITSLGDIDSLFYAVRMEKSGVVLLPNPKELNCRMACPHPGALLKTDFVKTLGGFDEGFRIASDYDLICRYMKKYPRYAISARVAVSYMGGGISEVLAVEGFLEEELIRIRQWDVKPEQSIVNSYRFFSRMSQRLGAGFY